MIRFFVKRTISNNYEKIANIWNNRNGTNFNFMQVKNRRKIGLNPGEAKDVSFTLTSKDLEFFGATREWKAEPGEFKLWVGTNSAEGLERSFTLK